jgi:hypothetical protein
MIIKGRGGGENETFFTIGTMKLKWWNFKTNKQEQKDGTKRKLVL